MNKYKVYMHIDASRITNIAYQNIYKVCKNIRKKAGGYCWKYEY